MPFRPSHLVLASYLLIGPTVAQAAPGRAPSGGTAGPRDNTVQIARSKVAIAREAHRQGDYEKAIAAWREANALRPRPALLFNLAQSQRMAGRWRESRETLVAFLDQLELLPERERAGLPEPTVIRARLAELDDKLRRLADSTATAARQVHLDGAPTASPPPVAAEPQPIPTLALLGPELTAMAEEPRFSWWTASLWAAAGVLATAAGASWLIAHQGWMDATREESPRMELDRQIGLYESRLLLAQTVGVTAILSSVAAASLSLVEP